MNKIVKPLLRILHSPIEIQAVVLADCAIIAKEKPVSNLFKKVFQITKTNSSLQHLLADHVTEFFTRFDDTTPIKLLRLDILTSLANETNVRLLLREFLTTVKDSEEVISAGAIGAIGICAEKVPSVAEECLKTLIRLSQSKNGSFFRDYTDRLDD